jgi:hypothetical protein
MFKDLRHFERHSFSNALFAPLVFTAHINLPLTDIINNTLQSIVAKLHFNEGIKQQTYYTRVSYMQNNALFLVFRLNLPSRGNSTVYVL